MARIIEYTTGKYKVETVVVTRERHSLHVDDNERVGITDKSDSRYINRGLEHYSDWTLNGVPYTSLLNLINDLNTFFFDVEYPYLEVDTRNDLPINVSTPVTGTIYIVKFPLTETILGIPYKTYQSGWYIRDTQNGNLNDWRRLNIKTQFTTSELEIHDSIDFSKYFGFIASALTSGVKRFFTLPDKDGTIALLDDIPPEFSGNHSDLNLDDGTNPHGTTKADTWFAENDDYSSNQISIVTLDSSYYDFNFSGYGTLRAGEYQFQTTGANISNPPFLLNASAIYNIRLKVNNNSWHSIEVDFSTQGDFNNQDRKWYRSGQTFVAAQGIGWRERILQPQYEVLKSIDDFINNPRPGQTTEGLINNTNILETYLSLSFTPRRSGNFSLSSFFNFSLNDGGQDFIAELQLFEGATLSDSRLYQKEPKDTAGGGIVLNLLSGGSIVGSANTSTNQRDGKTPVFDVQLTAGVTYNLLLVWSGSENNDLAAIYSGQISIKENLLS